MYSGDGDGDIKKKNLYLEHWDILHTMLSSFKLNRASIINRTIKKKRNKFF